ncbi:Metallo-beta-lactamase superfamily protein [Caldanaerovirga acetigignens]|uniref:Metallo-beta-lactamase superfamily protein n=1 Tax=Caldanaerovirga acetigignens TaxID=447595 RepID=A0A1M7IBT9_9FIRM|nr:MBL fold metallo-hydrolase [Caldanaerovirga acetigignens]SHM38232.1 Metallo-beta-lactamase superfamily protein [Caldanaerovirga acetigignens]
MKDCYPRFIALPVRQGDAFFFKTQYISILVDGGNSSEFINYIFKRYIKRESVDILICTHNDADHANGVLGFIESGLGCGEIWLPSHWAAVLPHLERPFEEFIKELYKQSTWIMERKSFFLYNEPKLRKSIIEAYGDLIAMEKSSQFEDIDEDSYMPFKERGSEEWHSNLEFEETWPNLEGLKWQISNWVLFWELLDWQKELLWQAIEAGKRIRKIAEAAYHRGIPIRWFEFCQNSSRSSCNYHEIICPLNAREVVRIKPCEKEKLLDFLALTTSNRESLVFFIRSTDEHPGVLLTAESDLKGIDLRNLDLKNAIITAPHHGSEDNAYAYKHVVSAVSPYENSLIWVRSDAQSKKRPGQSFLKAPGRRFCTICRGSRRQKQPVRFIAIKGKWIPCSNECICK